jgi:hypothetical protein
MVHEPSVNVKVMVFEPALAQDTECGPAVEAVAGVAPVPKFQE